MVVLASSIRIALDACMASWNRCSFNLALAEAGRLATPGRPNGWRPCAGGDRFPLSRQPPRVRHRAATTRSSKSQPADHTIMLSCPSCAVLRRPSRRPRRRPPRPRSERRALASERQQRCALASERQQQRCQPCLTRWSRARGLRERSSSRPGAPTAGWSSHAPPQASTYCRCSP
jgi:hypothetical protein